MKKIVKMTLVSALALAVLCIPHFASKQHEAASGTATVQTSSDPGTPGS